MPAKRRRQTHSSRFKAQVVEETLVPGVSVAAVAQRHNLNANLIHKWRRTAQSRLPAAPAFIPLPALTQSENSSPPPVRIELTSACGPVNLFWPGDQPRALAEFLKSLS